MLFSQMSTIDQTCELMDCSVECVTGTPEEDKKATMRVIRRGSGWDIALDMVFTDEAVAKTIAARLLPAIHALVREAVDPSMCERKAATSIPKEIISQRIPLENLLRAPASDANATSEPWCGPTFHSTLGGPHSKPAQAKAAV